VSYIGFASYEQEIDLSSNQKITIELLEDSALLEEVVVVAEPSKNVDIRSPQMSVSNISNRSLKRMPAVLGEVDVIKSIQMLPGVTNA
ncbi:MAG: hypothetical protein ACPF80_05980, partial [Flavobacteriaceae bacterium]